MTDGEHPSAKQDLLSRLCSALISVCSFLQNASKNRLVTRVLTQQKTIYILFQAYPRMLGELSILLTRCANSDARYRTQPASKEHTVFHMYGTYILPYANMCCNCCCCQHPPTGCIICGVRNCLTSDPAKHKGIYQTCFAGTHSFPHVWHINPPVCQHVLQLLLLPTSTNRMHHMRCQKLPHI